MCARLSLALQPPTNAPRKTAPGRCLGKGDDDPRRIGQTAEHRFLLAWPPEERQIPSLAAKEESLEYFNCLPWRYGGPECLETAAPFDTKARWIAQSNDRQIDGIPRTNPFGANVLEHQIVNAHARLRQEIQPITRQSK